MAGQTKPGRVVLCGSMSAFGVMADVAERLEAAGVSALLPSPDEQIEHWTTDASNQAKREASKRHMRLIKDPQTAAVLVINVDRRDVHDYVGPNSFAEIGVAFADDRPVFLLQGMPDAYADELMAWEVRCLNGDLRPLIWAVSLDHGPDDARNGRRIGAVAV